MPAHLKCKSLLLSSIIACYFLNSCNKQEAIPPVYISSYEEMFAALNLQFDVNYKYVERINNLETGNKGTIKFSLTDTSMIETFNSMVTKDHFRLDSMKAYSAKFESLGFNRYNPTQSVFINSAQQTISYVEHQSMISFGVTSNGSYYFYQYILTR